MIRSAALAALVLLAGLGACRVEGLDLAGKACPCATNLECDPVTNTCFPLGVLDFSGSLAQFDLARSDDATLIGLSPSVGTLSPLFSPSVFTYTLDVALPANDFTLTATSSAPEASILIDTAATASGQPSAPIDVTGSVRPIMISVVAPAGNSQSYAVIPRRARYLKASKSHAYDNFGRCAASGDTLLVSAYGESSCAKGVNGDQNDQACSNAGAAYVFTRSGTTWVQQAYLKASNTIGSDARFGYAVAIDGDTLAVSAPFEDSCATGVGGDQSNQACLSAGAVYVFTRSGGVWSQQAYLKASNAEAFDLFGTALALSGDTLAVGAYGERSCSNTQTDNACTNAGAVYVFVRSGTTWTQQAYVKAPYPRASSIFGDAVALQQDTLVVGASGENSCATGIDGDQMATGCTGSGAAWIFTRGGSTWTEQVYLKPAAAAGAQKFGTSLALQAGTLVVGAIGGAPGSHGVAYVFAGAGAFWVADGTLEAPPPQTSDALGSDVAVYGSRILVGAPGTESSTGRAYTFTRGTSGWQLVNALRDPNADPSDYAGAAVALTADWLAVGALGEASSATGIDGAQDDNASYQAGAVFVYAWP